MNIQALTELGRLLTLEGYRFVTSSPATHARVLARSPGAAGRTLRDVFGFSRPFAPGFLPREMHETLRAAGCLEPHGALVTSTVRWSSLGNALYAHSAYPTTETDAVFFGPDTYRFAAFVAANAGPARLAVDIGCGTGAGGLSIASRVTQLVLADVTPRALEFASVNARLAGITHATNVLSDVLNDVVGAPDLVIANPPYLADEGKRTYRDGGGSHGAELSIRIVRESLERLAPGGTLLVYTGSAIVDGHDAFRAAVEPLARDHTLTYTELDPDVFGEELERPAYRDVERIAAVGLRIDRHGGAAASSNERANPRGGPLQ